MTDMECLGMECLGHGRQLSEMVVGRGQKKTAFTEGCLVVSGGGDAEGDPGLPVSGHA